MNTLHSTKGMFSLLYLTLLLSISPLSFASNDQGIQFFEGTLIEAQTLAELQRKPVFVQLTASWCLPCRQMDKTVFPLSSVGSFFNSNFISLKVDADSFDGIGLKQNYEIKTVPESFFFHANGSLMLREGGFKGEQDILAIGGKILKKHPKPLPNTQAPIASTKNQKGDKGKVKIKENKRSKKTKPTANSSNLYTQKSGFELFWLRLTGAIKKPQHMEWVYHNAENFDSKAMGILLRQKKHYQQYYGEATVNNHIKSILFTKLAIATGDQNEELFSDLVKVARKAKLPESDHFVLELQSRYFEGIGDDDRFVKVTRQFMRSYKDNDPAFYHRKAWELTEHSNSKADLSRAISWLEKSTSINPQFYNLKSLAEFYHKAGKKRKARKTANWTIEYAKKEGRQFSSLLEIAQ